MINLFQSQKNQIFIIIALTLLSYSTIFANQLVIDDFDFIVNWESSHQLNLINLITGDQPGGHEGVYRPLRSLLYGVYYQIFGTNPLGYHLHSLLVHLISTILVYLIIQSLVKTLRLQSLLSHYLPFLTSLLFGLHPIHTEAITYIAASMEMTGVVFFLSSFLMYQRDKKLLSILFALLAFFTYEMTLTLPFVLWAYDFSIRKLSFQRKFDYLKGKLVYFLGILVFFLLKLSFTHNLNRGEYLADSFYLTALVMLKAFVKYLELLSLPINLSLVHILPGGIPTLGGVDIKKQLIDQESLLDPSVLLGLILALGLVFLAFKLKEFYPLISFGLFWFLITLIPASQIIPLQVVMGEKYLYLPSVGFALVIGYLFVFLSKKVDLKVLTTIYLLVVLGYMALTVTYNQVWKTPEFIWLNASLKANQSASAHYNLAAIYQSEGQLIKAKEEYLSALEVDSEYHPALNNLGFVYLNLNDLPRAKATFEKAIFIKDFYPMHYGLALVYKAQNNLDQALVEYQKTLILNPNFSQAKQEIELIQYQKSRN